MTDNRKGWFWIILNFKGYNLNWVMVAAQRPWCSIKESRNRNSHRGIGLYRIIACALLACYQWVCLQWKKIQNCQLCRSGAWIIPSTIQNNPRQRTSQRTQGQGRKRLCKYRPGIEGPKWNFRGKLISIQSLHGTEGNRSKIKNTIQGIWRKTRNLNLMSKMRHVQSLTGNQHSSPGVVFADIIAWGCLMWDL